LTEIREANLRFTLEETADFLNDLMELALSAEDIHILESRTEGWIAGLQLAAIALQSSLTIQDRGDKHDVIVAFSGSHHHLIDYLAQEVFSGQPDEVQSFLLYTSILERFNASLCDAVLGTGDWGTEIGQSPASRPQTQALLDELERKNLFLVPLDKERHWFRYHHLLADFLSQQLHETHPGIIPDLFIRASQWFESRDMVDEAMEYALNGGDELRAARVLDENVEAFILFNAEVNKVLRWARRLPEDVRAKFPCLCIYHAWALQFEYQLQSVEPTLALAEAHLADPVSLTESFSAIQIAGHASAIRAYTAMKMGELDRAVELSLAALRVLPKENTEEVLVLRGAITLGLGMGYFDLALVMPN
jgi:LuxR family maltose regulon positive regulatory protein